MTLSLRSPKWLPSCTPRTSTPCPVPWPTIAASVLPSPPLRFASESSAPSIACASHRGQNITPHNDSQARLRLAHRAHLAYEIGGLRLGLRTRMPALPLYLLANRCRGSQVVTGVLTLALLCSAVGLIWARGALVPTVRTGLFVGSLCAAVPIAMKFMQRGAVIGCRPLTQFCLYGGLLPGAHFGHRLRLLAAQRPRHFALAASVAALTGAIGCTLAGLAGVAGMTLGVLCASMPFLIAARAR